MMGKENPNGFKSGKINWSNKLIPKEMNIIPALEISTMKYIATWKLVMIIYKVEYIVCKWWLQLCKKIV